MKILLTGSTGFIGGHLIERLTKDGYKVRAPHRRNALPHYLKGFEDKVEFVKQDITFLLVEELIEWASVKMEEARDKTGSSLSTGLPRIPESLEKIGKELIGDADSIIHSAALASDWAQPVEYIESNILLLLSLLEAMKANPRGRLVYVSSISVHGFGPHVQTKENGTYYPVDNYYQMSKRVAESLALFYHKEYGLDIVIVRPANVYGERDTTTMFPIMEAMKKKKMGFLENGVFLTSPVYIGDLVNGVILALGKEKLLTRTFNLTGPRSYTWKELLKVASVFLRVPLPKLNLGRGFAMFLVHLTGFFRKLTKTKKPPQLTKYRVDQLTNNYDFANGSAGTELGYKPEIDLEEGMRRTVDSFNNYEKE